MAIDKVKVAVIGVGIGGSHLSGYAKCAGAEIAAICDIDAARGRRAADEYGVKDLYTDHREMLQRDDIQGVSVCLPNFLHAPVAIDCFNAKKAVLCEKPIATTPAEGEAMVAAAKAKPNTLNVALPALPQRIAFEMLRAQAGAPMFGIPYKGSASALPEVMGGQVPLIVDSITALRPHIQSGRLKALAVTSLKSTELMPGVKSVAEQGVPGYELTSWNALFAPRGTPEAVVNLLNSEVRKILVQPETLSRLGSLGFEAVGCTPRQLAETVHVEREKWGRVIRAANIKAE